MQIKKSHKVELLCVMVYHPLYPFAQITLLMFTAMSLLSGLRILVSATLSILELCHDSSQLSCFCPVSWSSCSFGSARQAPHVLQQFSNGGDVEVGQVKSLDLGLCGGSWAGQAACSPMPIPPGIALLLCSGEGQGQLIHSHNFRTSSPTQHRRGTGTVLQCLCPQA